MSDTEAKCIIIGMYPALFLDRDGVIIENRPNYVRSWEDVQIYPQALKALARISNSQYKIVMVTNQSVVGRGFISLEMVNKINDRLAAEINKYGGRIDGVFVCPHAPEENCNCRKPRPGLLLEAAKTLSIDLSRSVIIGDALSDLLAGQSAGLDKTILVRTGRGATQANLSEKSILRPFLIFDTLYDAILDIK